MKQTAIIRPELSGTVYHFFGEIDTASCKLEQVVDGGDWDLIFINESRFLKIDYFMTDKSVCKGLYHWKKDSLILDFDSISVDRITETKYGKSKGNNVTISLNPVNKVNIQTRVAYKLTVKKCSGGTPYLSWKNRYKDALRTEEDGLKIDIVNADKYIQQLKNDSIWGILNAEF